jgi:hypothetical protein
MPLPPVPLEQMLLLCIINGKEREHSLLSMMGRLTWFSAPEMLPPVNIIGCITYIPTYYSRFIPEGVPDTILIFPETCTFYRKKLGMRNTAVVTGSKPIAVWLQSISGVNATLVTFYDIHERKGEVLFFCSVTDPTWDWFYMYYKYNLNNKWYELCSGFLCRIESETRWSGRELKSPT